MDIERMTVDDLLACHAVNPARLDPAPADPSRAQTRARYALHLERPCSACGKEEDCRTSRVIIFPDAGPRWVDLCRDDSLATMPRWTGPTTIEGILADLHWAAGTMSFMDEPGRYHLLLTSAGQPAQLVGSRGDRAQQVQPLDRRVQRHAGAAGHPHRRGDRHRVDDLADRAVSSQRRPEPTMPS
ncbi:hypothetical protein ACIBJF_48315 [Streptomyces sp. NPDC050743]|uniref:hypothetical protein n=1 Tax=Streptomyces sp. NPDC050743 TaxID=3365634 RepID=UPI0037ADEB74